MRTFDAQVAVCIATLYGESRWNYHIGQLSAVAVARAAGIARGADDAQSELTPMVGGLRLARFICWLSRSP